MKKLYRNKEEYKMKTYNKNFFYNSLIQDIKHNSLPAQLDMADSVSMYYSIEARSPFLSHELLDYVFSLPEDFLYKYGKSKSILRKAAENVIPSSVLNNNEKIGFYISFREIFNNDLKSIKKIITNSAILKDILNFKNILKLLDKKNIKHSESKFLFSILNIALLDKINK